MGHGAVLGPPYGGVRELVEWALALWPYINGKCLYAGLNLREMETSNMLDVLHFLFESDTDYVSQEQVQGRDATRKIIYRSLYDIDYAYLRYHKEPDGGFSEQERDFAMPNTTPDDQIKPYMPPTQFDPNANNPFQGTLREAPLG